jgi:NAD(P)H-hydrate epimerase
MNAGMPTGLVTANEMRTIEARAAERGETGPVLMDRAARRIAAMIAERVPRVQGHAPRVLVLVGPGNNGGDGLWAARYLCERGVEATAYLWHRAGNADAALAGAEEGGVSIVRAAEDADGWRLAAMLEEAAAVVDALLGFGLQRDITGELAAILTAVHDVVARRAATARPLPVFAVDLPTGIDSDTGRVRGVALPAQVTITLGVAKRGLYLYPGAAYAGEIILGDIGVGDLTDNVQVTNTTAEQVRGLLPARPADANKGTFGSVLIVAGSLNYIGAAVLSTMGAMRIGVGLATLATPIELLPIVAAKLTECTFQPLPGDMGILTERSVKPLFDALSERQYKALLVGNGLGREKETLNCLRGVLQDKASAAPARTRAAHLGGFGLARHVEPPKQEAPEEDKTPGLPPLVLDADGLNLLHQIEGWAGRLPADTILTPHPGEMARLLDSDVETVQADRVGSAQRAAAEWKAIVVLKGANTVIAAPDGRVAVNPAASAALATAGTGDVLAGCIAGLLAQGLAPFDAAVAGVFVHGQAGLLVAEELGDAGALAGDLAEALPHALREIKG